MCSLIKIRFEIKKFNYNKIFMDIFGWYLNPVFYIPQNPNNKQSYKYGQNTPHLIYAIILWIRIDMTLYHYSVIILVKTKSLYREMAWLPFQKLLCYKHCTITLILKLTVIQLNLPCTHLVVGSWTYSELPLYTLLWHNFFYRSKFTVKIF